MYAGGHFGHTAKTTAIIAVAQGIVGDILIDRESGIHYSLVCQLNMFDYLTI